MGTSRPALLSHNLASTAPISLLDRSGYGAGLRYKEDLALVCGVNVFKQLGKCEYSLGRCHIQIIGERERWLLICGKVEKSD